MTRAKYVYVLWTEHFYELHLYEHFGPLIKDVQDIIDAEGVETIYNVREVQELADAGKCVVICEENEGADNSENFHIAIERRPVIQSK